MAELRNKLLTLTSLLELELDFADHEELEFADRGELTDLCISIDERLQQLIGSFAYGNAVRNGVAVAIIGATNVGKSTLLNNLVGDERAIVSDIHGTTRDTVEDTMVIEGILFRFIDTAGIRRTDNEIENIGIERSRQAAQKAQIVILVHDALKTDEEDYSWLDSGKVIEVYNKADLLPADFIRDTEKFYISAKTDNLSALRRRLVDSVGIQNMPAGVVISNMRHYEALKRAKDAICRVYDGLRADLSGELVALDLHDCLDALGEITGQTVSESVVDEIFHNFCVGK